MNEGCAYRKPNPTCREGGGVVLERAMFAFLTKLLLISRSRLHSRARLQAEILVLRQQVLILRCKSPSRVRLRNIDRVILVWLYRVFPTLLGASTVVNSRRLSWNSTQTGP